MGWENRSDCEECGGMWELYELTNGKRCNCDLRTRDMAPVNRSTASLSILFHKCWTHAVESTQYDKKEWQKLVSELRKFGLEMQ